MALPTVTSLSMLANTEVRIHETYVDYDPPVNVSAIVHKLLSTVPEKYVRGLDCVVLTNQLALSRENRVGKVWSRGRKVHKSSARGIYHYGKGSRLAYIELRVDRIVADLTSLTLRVPFAREVCFGSVLFHEAGHHIHRTVRPEYKEKEDVAERWAAKLGFNFIRKAYWYLMPLLRIYWFMRRRQLI
jgi:hypothetical protein